MQQYRVISHLTTSLGRLLEQGVAESVGHPVRVLYRYEDGLRSEQRGALTVLYIGLERRGGNTERELEHGPEGEELFRAPPMLMRARYLVSTWAPAPEDQALLGAVLRTVHDHPTLEGHDDEAAQAIAYDDTPVLELTNVGLEEHKLLSEAYGMPVAPSVIYSVDFKLQSAQLTPIKRVRERVIDFRKIDG